MSKAAPPDLPLHHLSSSHLRVPSPHLPERPSSASSSSIKSAFSVLSPQEVAYQLCTSLKHGLSPAEAAHRLATSGPNELPHDAPEPLWLRFLKQFKETLILLLLASATISFFVGNRDDAISITIAVTIVVTVGFVQEYRSEQSLEALNRLVPHHAHLVRDGSSGRPSAGDEGAGPDLPTDKDPMLRDADSSEASFTSAPQTSSSVMASQLVVGDVVFFATGDRIPADVRITRAADLSIDESNLTGENEPVRKSADALRPPSPDRAMPIPYDRPPTPGYASSGTGTVGADIRLNDQVNIAFMGTLVRSGHGQGIVIATGARTEFGTISASLTEIESPRTPLQVSMDRLGQELSYMSFGVIVLIVLIGLWQGRKLLEMFTIGVSLAVAAIPEGLPIIVTVTLALGVLRMAKHGAIVRRLPSVETLGSVNVICSDKTGTLTMNHMTVTTVWHYECAAPIEVSKESSSSTPDALTRMIMRIGNIANNARLSSAHGASPATAAMLSSILGPDQHSTGTRSRWVGQPTDVAMLDLLDVYAEDDIRERLGPRAAETPFSSERKWMGVIISGASPVESSQPGAGVGSEKIYIKGALEQVLSRCDTYLARDGRVVVLDEPRRQRAREAAEKMAAEGLRVLGFASGSPRPPANGSVSTHVRTRSSTPRTDKGAGVSTPPTTTGEDLYTGLCFAGLVGMYDPPRKYVDRAIRRLMAGRVKVIMITGDAETTAVAIAKKLGMPIHATAGRSVINGEELDRMSGDELTQAMAGTCIFARTSPDHKMKIVRALQARGDVVAMTGDGVNDAPALKKADIGVSMGLLGTDVAKEAADMILTDDDFSTILSAIEEGKGIFYNIQNFLTFQLSTSVAALSLVLLSTFLGLKNPLNAMQILWINILMDGPPAQSLGVEPVDPAVMTRPPRARSARVLTRPVMQRVLTSASVIMIGTMITYIREMSVDGLVTARDTTMTFTCFVLFDMFNALTCRSEGKSVVRGEIGLFSNRMFNYAVAGSLAGQLAVVFLPPLQRIFQTEALGFFDLVGLLMMASTVFWVDEARKWIMAQRRRGLGAGYSASV
ncbi:MAG: High affinity Ca2+/Mn2+ P-type ATPase-like protein [Thelocarpon superellum]|nr:MAG: High affinity Ca2+/Mn2+ P-type ATPase-like protein [Thelocarpon superellum]